MASTRRRYHPSPKKQKLRYTYPDGRSVLIGCTDTCFAVGADGATLGGVKVTEAQVRKLSNEARPDPRSPGLNLEQLRDVARKLHIDFAPMTGGTWAQLVTTLDNNGLVVAQLWYAGIGGGNIGHAVLLQKRRPQLDGTGERVRFMDPMVGKWDWIPAGQLRQAMDQFADMTGVPKGLRWGSFRRAPWISTDQSPQRGTDT